MIKILPKGKTLPHAAQGTPETDPFCGPRSSSPQEAMKATERRAQFESSPHKKASSKSFMSQDTIGTHNGYQYKLRKGSFMLKNRRFL